MEVMPRKSELLGYLPCIPAPAEEPSVSHFRATVRRALRRVGRVVLYGFAAVYFVIDLAFLSFIRPLRRAGLSLVLVPLAILEPVKPGRLLPDCEGPRARWLCGPCLG